MGISQYNRLFKLVAVEGNVQDKLVTLSIVEHEGFGPLKVPAKYQPNCGSWKNARKTVVS